MVTWTQALSRAAVSKTLPVKAGFFRRLGTKTRISARSFGLSDEQTVNVELATAREPHALASGLVLYYRPHLRPVASAIGSQNRMTTPNSFLFNPQCIGIVDCQLLHLFPGFVAACVKFHFTCGMNCFSQQ